jgi:biopolymer transport protein ExbD
MPRDRRRFPYAEISANLTPMIDVSFLLIVFFVLVSRLSDVEQAPLTLPAVREGVATRAGDEARIVVNVLPGDAGAIAGYAIGPRVFPASADGVAALAEQLADGYRRNPRLAVHLRADRGARYEWVEPAMRAVSTAARLAGGGALPRLDLVVQPDGRGEADDAR